MSDAFKMLADKVQKLEDFTAKMQRTYEDLLYNLDGDNIGDGVIEAKHIKAGAISAETISVQYGDVAELTVDWLQTTKKIGKYLDSDVTDDYYIDAHEQHIRFIQASVIVIEGVPQTEGLSNRQGDTLYWEKDVSGATITGGYPYIDGKRVLITKTNTGFPVTVYQYSLKYKTQIEFVEGATTLPKITLGEGTGTGNNGKGYIFKDTDGLEVEYITESGNSLSVNLTENGITQTGNTGEKGLRNMWQQATEPTSPQTGDYWDDSVGYVYNDLPPNPIIRSRTPAANNPTIATFVGAIDQYVFAINAYVSDNLELLHDWQEGTDILMHIHWATNGVDTTDRAVKWEITYTVANGNGTVAFPATQTISAETVIPANTPDRTHFITSIGTISGASLHIGSIICYNIKRITSAGTAPTASPFGLQVSGHIKIDTLGSKQLYSKN